MLRERKIGDGWQPGGAWLSVSSKAWMLAYVISSTLFSTDSCCITYLPIDSHISLFTHISLLLGALVALCLLSYFPCIYWVLTHLLLLKIWCLSCNSRFVSPTSSPRSSLPLSSQRGGPAFTMWGFIRSAWTALTLVMRFHYWTKVRDPSSVRLSSLLHLIYARPPSLSPAPDPYAVTQHGSAAAAGLATVLQKLVL